MLADGLPKCHEPDTDEPCPLDEIKERLEAGGEVSDDEYRLAEDECDACFWSSDEYRDLTTYGPLFNFAADWLRRRDLGLESESLSYREQQAVLIVHSEIEAGRARRMKPKGKANAGEHGQSRH